MRKTVMLFAAVIAAAWTDYAEAEPKPLAFDAAAFGMREAALNMDLSPDGNRVVYVSPGPGRSSVVMVADLGSGSAKPILKSMANPESFSWCSFVSNDRIVCRYTATIDEEGALVGYARMISANVDGSDVKPLGQQGSGYDTRMRQFDGSVIDWLPGNGETVLMTRDFIPEVTKDSNVTRNDDGVGVVRINVRTLKTDIVERANVDASGYMSDGNGHVRLLTVQETGPLGQLSGRTRYQYRTAKGRDWQTLVDYQKDDFYPLAVDSTTDSLYALKKLDGRFALYRVKLDDSLASELVASNPRVDIDDVVRAGAGQRVIGYTYVDDRRHVVYFDPEYSNLASALSNALKLPQLSFVGSSADGNKLLIFASSDTDPGRFLRFDRTSKSVGEIVRARPDLADRTLSPVQSVSYPAADGTTIPAYLTLPVGSSGKGLPAVVLPHGGPSDRDEWGFDWIAQFLAARGYAVIQPNYRGSSGFGDAWLGRNGFKAWRTSITDVTSAAHWLVSKGIADSNRLAIVGWSYGGYAALQSAATEPALFKAVVAVAPVTDLEMLKASARNYTNYRTTSEFVGDGPQIVEGSPLRHVDQITAPVLLFHGTKDENVDVRQSRKMADALRSHGKSVEYVEVDGLDHPLKDSVVRAQMLLKAGQLLERTIGH